MKNIKKYIVLSLVAVLIAPLAYGAAAQEDLIDPMKLGSETFAVESIVASMQSQTLSLNKKTNEQLIEGNLFQEYERYPLLHSIFGLLKPHSLLSVSKVCKLWRHLGLSLQILHISKSLEKSRLYDDAYDPLVDEVIHACEKQISIVPYGKVFERSMQNTTALSTFDKPIKPAATCTERSKQYCAIDPVEQDVGRAQEPRKHLEQVVVSVEGCRDACYARGISESILDFQETKRAYARYSTKDEERDIAQAIDASIRDQEQQANALKIDKYQAQIRTYHQKNVESRAIVGAQGASAAVNNPADEDSDDVSFEAEEYSSSHE